MNAALNERVQQIINQQVESGEEVGLQVAAYVDGKLAVDAWAGVADETTGRLVDGETLFTSWSTTKGFVVTALHILAEQGRLAYDEPVATYWPEFAANGKGAVTVRQALTHRAGIPQMPEGVTPEMMTDWDAMCQAIAAQTPLWEPGTVAVYHAWTFGWIIGELIHRVDGRPVAQFIREELCQPLGIEDFYLGIPDEVETRVARLRQNAAHWAASQNPDPMERRIAPPEVTTAEIVNRPDLRRAVIPGGGGIMNARAIARHYAMLAQGGTLAGVRILSPERVAEARALQTDVGLEEFGGLKRRALGYTLGGETAEGGNVAMGHTGTEFGHGGNGGSIGFADPARRLSVGLTKTLMKADPPTQAVAYVVTEAIRDYLDQG